MVFDSMAELIDRAEPKVKDLRHLGREFSGVDEPRDALPLARDGWTETLPETLSVAEAAIAKVETDTPFETFVPEYGVTGCEVDVARFLSGEPECMVDYPLVEIVRAGRVITLCASIAISGSVKPESIIRRGRSVVALALALSRLGYATEIWTDFTARNGGWTSRIRTLVKSAHDEIDPERLLYALAHPSMLRIIHFAAQDTLPSEVRDALGWGRGRPVDPTEDLPEGTIYLPCVLSNEDIPDLETSVISALRKLEILPAQSVTSF